MNKVKCAVFDLDGTLVNTITDLGRACDILLEKHGLNYKWSEEDYKKFVGDGAKKLVERAFANALGKEKLEEIYAQFKPLYLSIMLDNAHAYNGIKEQLATLKERGIKLAVVTNKPHEAAINMVEHIFGKGFFDIILGAVDGLPTKPDPAGVFKALEIMNCKSGEAIYFGDSNVDMQTARNAGIKAIGVTWGFRSYEELRAEAPFAIIDKPEQITSLFQ